MSFNQYHSQGGYPGQAPGYPGQVPGVPQAGYPSQIPGAPPAGYPGQARGPTPAPYGRPQPMPQASGYPGQQPMNRFPGQGSGGGFASVPPQPTVDPTMASWFRAVDQDNSGEINGAELRLALQNGNWSQFSEEACNLMISMFDTNHSGTINLSEFCQLFSFVNQWTETYQRYDQDKSGTISETEMNMALQQMGYRLSPQFIGFLMAKFSPRTRAITLDSFILVNIKLRNLTEAFKSQDREMKGIVTINYEQFLNMAFASIS